MRLRISADLLHRFYSFKNGKYIQYSLIFETQEPAQNLFLSFLADLCGAALTPNAFFAAEDSAANFASAYCEFRMNVL